MPAFTRAEIEDAFAHYQEVAAKAASSGDWRPWADLFTDDARYIEHVYGEFTGREAIYEWITKTMHTPPNDQMNAFPIDWYVIDEERGWVLCAVWNRMAPAGDGKVHQAINWTRLMYAGGNQWSSEEDIYNPMEFHTMIEEWKKATS